MKCILAAGIESISGTMKGQNGKNLTFRTYNRLQADGTYKKETRVYLQPKIQRSTPLSENEIEQRKRFSEAATYYKNLSEEQRMAYYKPWKSANYCYNGKKYNTLRGYVIARFIAEHKSN